MLHPRGAEIRAAHARVEEAADRCKRKGGGQAPVETPAQPEPSRPEPAEPAPSPQNPDAPDSDEADRDWDYDDYEAPALGPSDILALLGLLMGSGSSR